MASPSPFLIRLGATLIMAPVLFGAHTLRALGLANLGRLGKVAGQILLALGFRRRVVASNLELALGKELSPQERERLLKRVYQSTATVFLEVLRNFSLDQAQMREELEVDPADAQTIRQALARGKGAVFISAHVANWELSAMGMAAHGFPVAIVVKKMNNRISQELIERQRERTNLTIIYAGGTLLKMKELLAQGKAIGFMVDQNTTGTKGIRANFFGVPASSIRGLAHLVKETGTPVIPYCAFRLPSGKHKVWIGPEIIYQEAPELPAGRERELREEWLNTQAYQTAIEAMIRLHPEQWLWVHRRWKARRDPLDPAKAHLEN